MNEETMIELDKILGDIHTNWMNDDFEELINNLEQAWFTLYNNTTDLHTPYRKSINQILKGEYE